MAQLLLFTDRPELEASVREASVKAGLVVSVHTLDEVADALTPTGAAALFDGAAVAFDEDELLASVGLARAVGLPAAVILPEAERYASIEDLLFELCGGCVAHSIDELGRIALSLARRAELGREERFEYLSVSPRGSALLAILGDGRALLLARPLNADDDGGEIKAIQLSADARSAEIELASGGKLSLRSNALSRHHANGSSEAAASLADIDGATLGRRLRTLRLAAGLTQAELARRTGIHRPNIARVEAGRHTPSLETLARLAQAIGVPTTRVLSG
jgi:DNA-binding XRE family transcriptional regulator